jgi:hypothetical protein
MWVCASFKPEWNMLPELWWPSGHEFESHHPHLFDKNQAQDNVGLCKFQARMTVTWGGVLEKNINHILGPHLTV